VERDKVYIRSLVILKKRDMVKKEVLDKVKGKISPDICISAEKNINIEELMELIYKKLRIIRIYLKEYNKKADLVEPMIMWKNSTLKDLCLKMHKDFSEKFKFARIWGSSKFPGQHITKLNYELKDKDIVELRLK
jgi:hypothetical protein